MLARHMLQGSEWSSFQNILGKDVIQRSGPGWFFSAVTERGFGRLGKQFSRLYVQYGPYAESKQAMANALVELEKLGREYRVDYVRVEPILASMTHIVAADYGYATQKRTFQPQHTNWLDIDRQEEDIIASFNATNRTSWRNAEKRGHTFETVYTEDKMDEFLHMMEITGKRTGSVFHDGSYLKTLIRTLGPTKSAGVIYVSFEGKRIASTLYIDDREGSTRYYMFAGTEDEARKLGANSTLVSYMILDAHKKGLKRVDLFGVTPPDAPESHPWMGLSRFKRSFGGEDVSFNGTWEKPLNKQRYFIMKLARMLANKR